MLASGAVQPVASDKYGDRFCQVVAVSLYDAATGLRLDPTYRDAETNIIS